MISQKRKIIVIENEQATFSRISERIKEFMGDMVTVYPLLDGKEGTLEYFHHFIEDYVQMEKYEEILEFYKDADLFIVDVFLKNNREENGLDLEKKIHSYLKRTDNTIIISSAKYGVPNALWKKDDLFIDQVLDAVISKFPDIEHELLKSPTRQEIKAEPVQAPAKHAAGSNPRRRSLIRKAKDLNKLLGPYYTTLKVIKWINAQWKHLMHGLISVIFYILILVTVFYGAFHIFQEFFPNLFPQLSFFTGEKISVQKESGATDTQMLERAEHIFVYLLPIFIVFGFYIYYQSYTSIYFLNGTTAPRDKEFSTQSMNFTKVIFISSIISYTLIKAIDKIFFKADLSMTYLIATGLFLVLLMLYYRYISDHKH